MRGKSRLLFPLVLAVLSAFSSVQNVFASTEIAYDSGPWNSSALTTYMGVRFTPTGQVKVVGIRVYGGQVASGTGYITDAERTTVLSSFPVTLLPGWTWTTIAVPNGPVVSGDFFVIVSGFTVLCDASNDYSRSYVGTTMFLMFIWTNGDIMIRALVDPVGVGGVVLPTNPLTVLAPYLTVIGLVATAAVAVKKRRNELVAERV